MYLKTNESINIEFSDKYMTKLEEESRLYTYKVKYFSIRSAQ